MRPVLEKRPVLFQKRGQVAAPVGLIAGENNLVVGALHRADAVHLHETEFGDELQQTILGKRLAGRRGKPLPRQKTALPLRSKTLITMAVKVERLFQDCNVLFVPCFTSVDDGV